MFNRALYTVLLILCIINLPNAYADMLRVSPQWLHSHLHDSNLTILDTRPVEEYQVEHIAGAISFPDSLTYQQKSVGGMIVEPDVMQKILRERGIDRNKLVVVYDAGQLIDAARVFWTLEVYGLAQVKILSPGYESWINAELPVTQNIPTVTPSQYITTINHQRIASKFSTQLAIANPKQVVIDARAKEAYQGKTSTAKRFGHIPTAKNYPVLESLITQNDSTTLRDAKELKQLYSNLNKDNKVILYCEVGRVSATNYLVLRELGYDVANYDGSWREWGNDENLPIEK